MRKQLLLLCCTLLAIIIAVRATNTKAKEWVPPSTGSCGTYQCLPGIDSMGVGFDLVAGKSTFVPVTTFTYNKGNSYVNPFNSSEVYNYPDQTAVADYFSYDIVSLTFASGVEYSNYLAYNAGVNVHAGSAFALSGDVSYVNSITEGQGNTYSHTQQLFTVYQVEALPPSGLQTSALFKAALARMPTTYNPTLYSEFIQYFGTHYVAQALYGGKALVKSNVQSEYASNNSPFVISGNAKVAFSNMKNGGGGSYSYPAPTNGWEDSSSSEAELIGGNPFLPIGDWTEWIASIQQAPAQVSYRLKPITDLVTDPVIAKNIQTYINAYYKANEHVAPPTKPTWVKLAPCKCYASYSNYYQCESGYFWIGSEIDGNGLAVGPPTCCEPCYSWGQLQAFMANTSSAAAAMDSKIASKSQHQKVVKANMNQEKEEKQIKPNKTQLVPPGPNTCGKNPCLPGLSSMGIGMDVISGRLKSQPIIAFTYAQANEWNNPFTNQNFAYPDQAVVVDSSSHDVNTYVFSSVTEYASYLASKAGISGGWGSFFSASLDVQSVSSIFSENLAKLGITTQMASMYEVTLVPTFLLSYTPVFQEMVTALPATYDESAYANFVDYFGTHYVTKALYGGQAVMKTAVDQHYFSIYDESYISAQMSVMYDMFQIGANFWRNHTQSFGEFLNASYSEVHLIGGNYADFNIDNWNAWVESIGQAPVQVSYTLAPISDLVTDVTIQANLNQYVAAYVKANNHTQPPVTPPPPMASCNENTAEYTLENCNTTKQLIFSFAQLEQSNGATYFEYPENCATPCYGGAETDQKAVPQLEVCDCYVENADASYCIEIQSFVSGYDGWFKSAFGGYYPIVPPWCCRPCYKANIPNFTPVDIKRLP